MRITADGWYGAQTAKAVAEYQRRAGLVVDGVAGPKTQAMLRDGSVERLLRESDLVAAAEKLGVQLAKIKGLSDTQTLYRHVFRNAFVPMVQYLPTSFLNTVVGSIYIESLYAVPGMGGLLITSIQRQDNTMVQAMVLLYSIISVVGLLLGDIAMMVCDPRIKLVKKGGSR